MNITKISAPEKIPRVGALNNSNQKLILLPHRTCCFLIPHKGIAHIEQVDGSLHNPQFRFDPTLLQCQSTRADVAALVWCESICC